MCEWSTKQNPHTESTNIFLYYNSHFYSKTISKRILKEIETLWSQLNCIHLSVSIRSEPFWMQWLSYLNRNRKKINSKFHYIRHHLLNNMSFACVWFAFSCDTGDVCDFDRCFGCVWTNWVRLTIWRWDREKRK